MADRHSDIDELTRLVLADYDLGRPIDQLDVFALPNRQQVEKITDELFEIIYPGYYHDRQWKIYHIEHTLAMLLEDVIYNLRQQVAVALRFRPDAGEDGCGCVPDDDSAENVRECDCQAEKIVNEFVRRIPAVREKLSLDVEAFYEGDPAAENRNEIICSYPGLRAVTVYRLAHELVLLGVPILPRIMSEYAHAQTGIDIHPGAQIGDYFFIDHGTGVVIGETTVIGSHAKIYQGVTLGGLSTRGGQDLRGKKRHPTLEDRVTVYSGASILGGETVIGHDCVIGGNAFITRSVSPGTRVNIRGQELTFAENDPS